MSTANPRAVGEAPGLAHLVIPEAQGKREVLLDEGSTWRIGRTTQNEVMLPSEFVSRNHAMIQRTDDQEYYLIDLGSVNGSSVNGTRVDVPRTLKDGDQIKIGETVMTFRYAGPAVVNALQKTQQFAQTQALYSPQMITVLVVDVRDFTRLTQQIDQSVLCQAIGTWFRRGGPILRARGSWSIKYIGDAIMAVWLHKDKNDVPRDILGVLNAYLAIAGASADLVREFALPCEFRIGAGVNTGRASIGNAGGSGLTDFTAMGEAVNAAFRIESATKEAKVDIAMGQTTYKALRTCFHPEQYFRPYQVHLKGYDTPADVWGAPLEAAERFLAGTDAGAPIPPRQLW